MCKNDMTTLLGVLTYRGIKKVGKASVSLNFEEELKLSKLAHLAI